MSAISFGKIAVPLDQYAVQGTTILGIRGSGKSYTGTYIAEQLMGHGVPITGVDPIGIWRYLRVPGRGAGFPVVVVGGEHGDLPLTVASAEATMRAAMVARVSIIFDLYDVRMSKSQWRDVICAVVKVLLYENKPYGPRHLFVEEAAEFVPQRVGPDQGVVYGMMERLVRMGGNVQVGVTLINQRAEELNKAVLELCDCLVLHRQKGRRSLENLSHWLDLAGAKDIVSKVPLLENGEAYVWPTAEANATLTRIPEKRTWHPDRRTHHTVLQVAEGKSVDVGSFVEQLKAELARAKMSSPLMPELVGKALADQLAGRTGRIVLGSEITAKVNAAREEGFEAGLAKGRAEALKMFRDATAEMRRVAHMAVGQASISAGRADDLVALTEKAERDSFGTSLVARHEVKAAQSAENRRVLKVVDAMDWSTGELAIMKAIAMYESGVDRDQLSVLTGYKRSTRDKYIAALVAKQYVDVGDHGTLSASEAGKAALGSHFEPLPTGNALRGYWLTRLPEGERRLFERVVDAYPNEVHRGELSAHTGYKRSTRDKYLAHLQSRRLVEVVGDGVVKAAEALFP